MKFEGMGWRVGGGAGIGSVSLRIKPLKEENFGMGGRRLLSNYDHF